MPDGPDAELLATMRAIASGARVPRPTRALAAAALATGATRASPMTHWLADIRHYVYAGDTALHVAAAASRAPVARALLAAGAAIDARNRRGQTPLHYAVDGGPGSPTWDSRAQRAVVELLVRAGAGLDAVDRNGTTPVQRAVRNRCAAAVRALLAAGADATGARELATMTTGRGGSGSPAAKAQAAEILELLAAAATAARRATE